MAFKFRVDEQLSLRHPGETIISIPWYSWMFGWHKKITRIQKPKFYIQLMPMYGDVIGDIELKMLAQPLVFKLRTIKDMGERAKAIHAGMKSILPSHGIGVIVTDKEEETRPKVIGPNKGIAYFWAEEFGDHVTIVLA